MGKMDDELDDFDIDEFDDLESADTESRAPSSVYVRKEDFAELGKGIASRVRDKAYEELVPYNFRRSVDTADDIYHDLKDTVTDGIKGITSEFGGLLKEVSKTTPGFLSKPLDFIAEKLGYMEESDRRQLTEEEQRHSTITSRLDQIFNQQQSINTAVAAKTSGEISAVNSAINNLVNFNYTVAKEYYKTSLELQYKSYYVQYDILATQRTFFKTFSEQLSSISKNTSLPDYLKYAPEEYVGDLIKRNALNNMFNSLSGKYSYISRVKSNLKKYFSGKIQDTKDNLNAIREQLSMATAAAGMGADIGMSRFDMVKAAMLPIAANYIGDKIYGLIPEKLKKKIQDSKLMKKADSLGTAFMNSPSTAFNLLLDSLRNSKFLPDFLKDELGELANAFYGETYDTTLEKKGLNKIAELNNGAAFDNKVYRSITEVIPEYLAHILRESTITANATVKQYLAIKGYPEEKVSPMRDALGGKMMKYDFIEDRLSTEDEIRYGVLSRVKKEIEKNEPEEKAKELYYQIYRTAPKEGDSKFKSLKAFLEKANVKQITIASLEDVFSSEKRKQVFEGVSKEKIELFEQQFKKIKDKYEDLSDQDKKVAQELAKQILVSTDMEKFKTALNGIAKILKLSENYFDDDDAMSIYKSFAKYRLSNGKPIMVEDFYNRSDELFKDLETTKDKKDRLLSKISGFVEAAKKSSYRYLDTKEEKDMFSFISLLNHVNDKIMTIEKNNVKAIRSAYKGIDIIKTSYDEKSETVRIDKDFVLGDFRVDRVVRTEPSSPVARPEDAAGYVPQSSYPLEPIPPITKPEDIENIRLTEEEIQALMRANDLEDDQVYKDINSSLEQCRRDLDKGDEAKNAINLKTYLDNVIEWAETKRKAISGLSDDMVGGPRSKERLMRFLDAVISSLVHTSKAIQRARNIYNEANKAVKEGRDKAAESLSIAKDELQKLTNTYTKYFSDESPLTSVIKAFNTAERPELN
jgi:hypothetical protein